MRHYWALMSAAFLAVALQCEASSGDSKSAIESYFSKAKPVLKRKGNLAEVEVCFDTCDLYRTNALGEEGELWDAVFIHQFYFNTTLAAEEFRSEYASLAHTIDAKYSSVCPESKLRNAQSKCIANHLIRKLGLRYAFVRYDEGYRCEVSGSFINPNNMSKSGKCTRVKKAL